MNKLVTSAAVAAAVLLMSTASGANGGDRTAKRIAPAKFAAAVYRHTGGRIVRPGTLVGRVVCVNCRGAAEKKAGFIPHGLNHMTIFTIQNNECGFRDYHAPSAYIKTDIFSTEINSDIRSPERHKKIILYESEIIVSGGAAKLYPLRISSLRTRYRGRPITEE